MRHRQLPGGPLAVLRGQEGQHRHATDQVSLPHITPRGSPAKFQPWEVEELTDHDS